MLLKDMGLLVPGTQVMYVPLHVREEHPPEDWADQPGIERGFVTSVHTLAQSAFCRFWYPGKPGEMRTRVCSECAYLRDLLIWHTVDQAVVDELMEEIANER